MLKQPKTTSLFTQSLSSTQPDTTMRFSTCTLEPASHKSKAELLHESQSTIKDKEAAWHWLNKADITIPGRNITITALKMALLYLSSGKHDLCDMVNGIRAVALCLESIQPTMTAQLITTKMVEAMKDKMEKVTSRHLKTVEETISKMEEHYQSTVTNTKNEVTSQFTNCILQPINKKIDEFTTLITDNTNKMSEFTTKITSTLKALRNTPAPAVAMAASLQPPTHPTMAPVTYAATAQQFINSDQADIVVKAQIADKQILIFFDKELADSYSLDLTECDLVTKANTALELMDNNTPDKPGPVMFTAARKTCNGSILFQLNSTTAAAWLHKPSTQSSFLKSFSGTANIHNRFFHVIMEFVPVSFDANTTYSHTKIEDNNKLSSGSVTWSKYIKPPHLWSTNQTAAHIIIGLSSKEATNRLIQHGLYVEGKHVMIQKTLPDLRRCLKCQHFGHFASECKAMSDTCTCCALNHKTDQCPPTTLALKCANCLTDKAAGHGVANRDCPTFIAETLNLCKCNLENKYKFFPTDDPLIWTLLSEPIPHNDTNSTTGAVAMARPTEQQYSSTYQIPPRTDSY